MDAHFTRDYVWLVVTDNSFNLDYLKIKGLGITGLYFNAADSTAPNKILQTRANGMKAGVFYPANTEHQFGHEVAQAINAYRLKWLVGDGGQTPILLDMEPSAGSVDF